MIEWTSARRLQAGCEGFMDGEYVIYGGSISLFTRKLEAAMRFYRAPHRMETKTEEAGDAIRHERHAETISTVRQIRNLVGA